VEAQCFPTVVDDLKPVLELAAEFKPAHINLLREAALAGAGLAYLSTWLVMDDLLAGKLETVLMASAVDDRPIHLLWPRSRDLVSKVRVVVDELVKCFVPIPPWDRI
jgi:DNA-binding transcriptional LysR family regulator